MGCWERDAYLRADIEVLPILRADLGEGPCPWSAETMRDVALAGRSDAFGWLARAGAPVRGDAIRRAACMTDDPSLLSCHTEAAPSRERIYPLVNGAVAHSSLRVLDWLAEVHPASVDGVMFSRMHLGCVVSTCFSLAKDARGLRWLAERYRIDDSAYRRVALMCAARFGDIACLELLCDTVPGGTRAVRRSRR